MTEHRLEVRSAVVEDAEAIARTHIESWRETYSGILVESNFSPEAFNRRLAFWSRYLEMDPRPGKMIVAARDGVVVGFANSGPAKGPDAEHGHAPVRDLNLFSIYLLADAHSSGLGRMMLQEVLDGQPAQLWVLRGNGRAIAFYRRNGFDFDGVVFTDPHDPGQVELRMVR